jgi:hypothetical protein
MYSSDPHSFLVINEAPMVEVPFGENVLWTYRTTIDVFPTPMFGRGNEVISEKRINSITSSCGA